jgi:hypothetical protein
MLRDVGTGEQNVALHFSKKATGSRARHGPGTLILIKAIPDARGIK